MSYRGEQKIKGKIYVYEAVAVWNQEKKRSEQKRLYIGTRDPETGDFIPNKKCTLLEQAVGEGQSREDAILDLLMNKSSGTSPRKTRARKNDSAGPADSAPEKPASAITPGRPPVPEPTVSAGISRKHTAPGPAVSADSSGQQSSTGRTEPAGSAKISGSSSGMRQTPAVPLSAGEYGRSHALTQIAGQLGLTDLLDKCFSSAGKQLLAYAVTNRGDIPVIAEEQIRLFFLEWSALCGDTGFVSYYAGLRHYFPAGTGATSGSAPAKGAAPRLSDGRHSAEITLPRMTVLAGTESGLPLWYRFDEGPHPSMQDLVTGFSSPKPLDLLQVCFCFSEELYSDRSLYLLLQHGIRFIARMPVSAVPAASLLKGFDPDHCPDAEQISLSGRPALVLTKETVINGRHVLCHLCCDMEARRIARAGLLHHVCSLEEKVASGMLPMTDPSVRRYLSFDRKAGEGWICSRKEDTLREELKQAGCFILVSNGTGSAAPVLQFAQFGDDLTEIADRPGRITASAKGAADLQGKDPWSPAAISSELFCSFLRLILHARIRRLIRDARTFTGSAEEDTAAADLPAGPEALVGELTGIREVVFSDGTRMITCLTERQKKICRLLGVEM